MEDDYSAEVNDLEMINWQLEVEGTDFKEEIQLPYEMNVAAVSCITYVIAGILQNAVICLVIGIALQIGVLLAIKAITKDHTGRVKTTN